ncbi:hypothetical protein DFH09DRAFT_1428358 [Mycena vulgaris]|nr:hypothetical protein DFH09DRAFT_1428358 [Mycena vulgaris]
MRYVHGLVFWVVHRMMGVPLGRAGDIDTTGLAPSLDLHSPAHARGIYTGDLNNNMRAFCFSARRPRTRYPPAFALVLPHSDPDAAGGQLHPVTEARPYISGSGGRRNRWKRLALTRRVCMESSPLPCASSASSAGPAIGAASASSLLSPVCMHPVHVYFPIPRRGCTYIVHTCVSAPLGCGAVSTSSSVSTCPLRLLPRILVDSSFDSPKLTLPPTPTARDSSGPSCPAANCPSPAAAPVSARRYVSVSSASSSISPTPAPLSSPDASLSTRSPARAHARSCTRCTRTFLHARVCAFLSARVVCLPLRARLLPLHPMRAFLPARVCTFLSARAYFLHPSRPRTSRGLDAELELCRRGGRRAGVDALERCGERGNGGGCRCRVAASAGMDGWERVRVVWKKMHWQIPLETLCEREEVSRNTEPPQWGGSMARSFGVVLVMARSSFLAGRDEGRKEAPRTCRRARGVASSRPRPRPRNGARVLAWWRGAGCAREGSCGGGGGGSRTCADDELECEPMYVLARTARIMLTAWIQGTGEDTGDAHPHLHVSIARRVFDPGGYFFRPPPPASTFIPPGRGGPRKLPLSVAAYALPSTRRSFAPTRRGVIVRGSILEDLRRSGLCALDPTTTSNSVARLHTHLRSARSRSVRARFGKWPCRRARGERQPAGGAGYRHCHHVTAAVLLVRDQYLIARFLRVGRKARRRCAGRLRLWVPMREEMVPTAQEGGVADVEAEPASVSIRIPVCGALREGYGGGGDMSCARCTSTLHWEIRWEEDADALVDAGGAQEGLAYPALGSAQVPRFIVVYVPHSARWGRLFGGAGIASWNGVGDDGRGNAAVGAGGSDVFACFRRASGTDSH